MASGIIIDREDEGTFITLGRFASVHWLDRLKVVNVDRSMHLAGHLCSSRCEQVLRGDAEFVKHLYEEVSVYKSRLFWALRNLLVLHRPFAYNCSVWIPPLSNKCDSCEQCGLELARSAKFGGQRAPSTGSGARGRVHHPAKRGDSAAVGGARLHAG